MPTRVTDAVFDPLSGDYTFEFTFPLTALGTDWVEAEFGNLPQETVLLICADVGAHGPAKYRAVADGTIAVAAAHDMFDSTAEPLKFARARRAFSDACVAIHAYIMGRK